MNSRERTYERFSKNLSKWHEKNRRSFPWRERSTPFGVLVAEVLLQRTPADRVASFYGDFLSKYSNPCALAKARDVQLKREAARLGLVKRMGWLKDASKKICDEHRGEVPNGYEALLSLPGVGEYTASAVLSFGYGRDVAIVDVNVARVLSRAFGVKPELKVVKEIAEKLIPSGRGPIFNEALLDLAATVCKVRPVCLKCPLSKICNHNKKDNNTEM